MGMKTRVPSVSNVILGPLLRLGPLSLSDDVIIGLKSHLRPGTLVFIP